MRHENHRFTTSSDSTGRGLVKLTKSYGSWTSIYILSLSNSMQFTNCTTRKPLFHDPYESYESYGSWACMYTPSPSNDMQFTNCTTRKPLFHDPYESYESYGSWTCIYTPSPSNDMQFRISHLFRETTIRLLDLNCTRYHIHSFYVFTSCSTVYRIDSRSLTEGLLD